VFAIVVFELVFQY